MKMLANDNQGSRGIPLDDNVTFQVYHVEQVSSSSIKERERERVAKNQLQVDLTSFIISEIRNPYQDDGKLRARENKSFAWFK